LTDQNKEILRVSLDELSAVTTDVVPLTTPDDRPAAKSYGNIHEPATPEILAQEKGSIFLKAWIYLGLAGLIGAVVGWGIAEPGFVDDQGHRWGNIWILPLVVTFMCTGFAVAESIVEPGFVDDQGHRWGNIWILPLVVTFMCTGFAVAESIVERSARKAAIRIGITLPLGVVLGFILSMLADLIYNIALGICAAAGAQSFHNPAVWIARGLAWAVFGIAGGIVYGIIGRSGRKTSYGALGGALGAAIGGLIFDPISFATHGGVASRAVGFGLLGLATGIAMGLVESALKDRWLYVTSGPLAGKQFILYKPQTNVGRTQNCDIYLFKDPDILPQHATLVQKGGRVHLIADGPVYISGQRVHGSRVLESGSIIQVGRYSFRYQERLRG